MTGSIPVGYLPARTRPTPRESFLSHFGNRAPPAAREGFGPSRISCRQVDSGGKVLHRPSPKRYHERYHRGQETKKGITPCVDVIPFISTTFVKSGRLDLNQRPLRPERSALARLSYAPQFLNRFTRGCCADPILSHSVYLASLYTISYASGSAGSLRKHYYSRRKAPGKGTPV